jgi:hypothetical protein
LEGHSSAASICSRGNLDIGSGSSKKGSKMKQDIKLDEPQKKQFNSIMAGMEFIDKMTAAGYSVEEAFTALEKIMGIKK